MDATATNRGSMTTQGSQGSSMSSHSEGPVAKTIENQTARLPSDTFLWAAIGAMGVSAAFQLLGRKHMSLFIGQWVSPFLLFGVYNKIVKVAGSDQRSSGGSFSKAA